MRKRLMRSFLANEKAAMAAMARRWGSTKHVHDMWELLARLEGEMTKEAGEGARGVSVLILANQGASPLDPETFRAAGAIRSAVMLHKRGRYCGSCSTAGSWSAFSRGLGPDRSRVE
jgi:predicted hydrolase (HD superfamily)